MDNRTRLKRNRQLSRTFDFNDVTAYVTPTDRKHGLVICLPDDKAPVGIKTQPINMPMAEIKSTISAGDYNVGHAITTRQIDVDFDTYNTDVVAAFDYFLPRTPYRLGRATKADSHWIFNLNEDFYEVAPTYKHIIKFMADEFKVLGKQVKVEYRYRTHKDNDFNSRLPAENPYVFAPGSVHTTGELVVWQDCFKEGVTAVTYDTQHIFKQTVLAIVSSMLVPHWIEGSRQWMTMALSGALQRMASVSANGGEDKGIQFNELDFETLIKGICHLTGDSEVGTRLQTFKQTWHKSRDPGIKTTGANTLSRFLGEDAPYIIKSMYDLITGIYSEINIQDLVERFFIERGSGEVIDLQKIGQRNRWKMTRQAFNNSYASQSVVWRGDRIKMVKFCYEYGVLDYVDGVDSFAPARITLQDYRDNIGAKFWQQGTNVYLNIWQLYSVAPHEEPVSDKQVEPFLHYIKNVIGTSDEKFQYIMSWLANIIQSPGSKPRTYPIIVGMQGAGKSFLFEQFLIPIMGENNAVTETNMEQVLTGFNSVLEGKTLTLFEEAINHNKREVASMLKQYITGKTMILRKKHEPDRQVNNFSRAVFLSNDIEQAVAVDSTIGERRACVFHVNEAYVGKAGYWEKLAVWARANLAQVHRYLLDYQYDPAILDVALKTEEKQTMQGFSLTYELPEIAWILERLEEGYPLDTGAPREWYTAYHTSDETVLSEGGIVDSDKWPDRISEAALREDLKAWAISNGVPRGKILGLKKRLRQCFPYLRQRHRVKLDIITRDHKVVSLRPVLSEFPSREEIIAHLKPRYGHVFSDALNSGDITKLETVDLSRAARLGI